jgi:hypothetical protein
MRQIGVPVRNLLFVMCVLAATCNAWARGNHLSWDNLKALQPGAKIQVLEMNLTRVSGMLLNVSDAAISVQDKRGTQAIQKQDVRSVQLMKGKNRLRNTLIGLGVGAGAGAGITAAAWESHGFLGGRADGAAFGAALGGLGGAVVGAFLPSHDKVYDAPSH